MQRKRTILLVLILAGALPGSLPRRAEAGGTSQVGPAPPDPTAVRAEVRQILSDPRFAPRKSIWDWLTERLLNWQPRGLKLPPGLKSVLVWMLLIWCVLALLAIFGHFIWTLAFLFRGSRPLGRTGPQTAAERLRHRSLEELAATMQDLAGRGAYREALGVMMLVLLKLLDKAGRVRFQEGKTNGEYVLEYGRDRPERDDFRTFVTAFESSAYGGRVCRLDAYQDMHRLFQRIRGYAEQEP